MLNKILSATMKQNGLSSHDVAEAVGVSHTTILRALRGDVVDLKTIILLANWLGVRPAELLNSLGDKNTLGDQVATLLAVYPEIREVLQSAVGAVSEGRADPAVVADIVQYAMYKLSSISGAKVENKPDKPGGGRTAKKS